MVPIHGNLKRRAQLRLGEPTRKPPGPPPRLALPPPLPPLVLSVPAFPRPLPPHRLYSEKGGSALKRGRHSAIFFFIKCIFAVAA